jgi:hypothetical protein
MIWPLMYSLAGFVFGNLRNSLNKRQIFSCGYILIPTSEDEKAQANPNYQSLHRRKYRLGQRHNPPTLT